MHADYEDYVFDRIVETATDATMSSSEVVDTLLHTTHQMVASRRAFVGDHRPPSLRRAMLSSDMQLQEVGACGTQVHVLARLLQRARYDVRIAQMRCGDILACHIVVEVLLDGRWVVLDPLYDLAFEREDGLLASFAEVSADWNLYKSQVPSGYDPRYSYEGVRYANWSKIPVILPLARDVLAVVMQSDVETVSIRPLVLNAHRVLSVFLLGAYCLVLVGTVVAIRRRRRGDGVHSSNRDS